MPEQPFITLSMPGIQLSRSTIIFLAVLAVVVILPLLLFREEEAQEKAYYNNLQGAVGRQEQAVIDSLNRLPIVDSALRQCIKDTAMDRARIPPQNSGSIDDVAQLEMLSCPRRKIRSIEGVERLDQLTYFDVSGNAVRDIDPLRSAAKLKSLDVTDNPVQSISVVRKLGALQSIRLPDLRHLQCADIADILGPVKSNLKSIHCISANAVSDAATDAQEDTESAMRLSDRQAAELREYEHRLRTYR